ncbi:hypothetical protein VPNG_09526 [Cytospora leucostoma]|uniref:Oxidoreductase AflY n=1 Tax=Cytospora leucostoma TaxID=1230097 RepID=A0A423VSF0_9PEZI|nr:hypothetical protein VPNG_09526 [Cytospora leucostoma]
MMLDTETFAFDPVLTPGFAHADNLTEEGARATEECLKENNEKYHIFFTTEAHMGVQVYLHNHIAHHDITLWALGATPDVLKAQHRRNALYMRDAMKIFPTVVADLEDDLVFMKCLGREEHFRNFEVFFMKKIKEVGYEAVLQTYLLGGSEIAEKMMCHQYMGYVHGLIHMGLALEFKQPLLLAEGLAQSAVHHDWWYIEFLTNAENLARKAEEPALPLATLIDMMREDPKLSTASSLEYHTQTRKHSGIWAMDKEMARDGVLGNAREEYLRLAARWRVDPNDVERATAELINTAVYTTAGAQRAPYQCTFDFWLLHSLTSCVGNVAFLKENSITKEQKARVLEYSGRVHMMTYAGLGTPQLCLDYLCSHRSKLPGQTWETVFERATRHADDGHMAKMIRTTKLAEQLSKPYDHLPEFRVKQDMFLIAGVAMIDSASAQPMTGTKHHDFIRGAAWEEAWEKYPKRNY